MDELVGAAASVKRYVAATSPTATEKDSSPSRRRRRSARSTPIDRIGDLFRKYALLLTASSWMTLEPVPQYDWLAVFREAWIPSEKRPEP
jgi:hypothetical protein